MVRHATREDLPRIYEIYENARAYMKRTGNPTQWGDTEPPIEWLDVDIERKELYVCADGDDVYGVFMFMMRDEPFYHHPIEGEWLNDEPYGTVHRIAAHGSRGGVFDEAIGFCKTLIDNVRIDTHPNNKTMQHLCERSDFHKCGVLEVKRDGSTRIMYPWIKGVTGNQAK